MSEYTPLINTFLAVIDISLISFISDIIIALTFLILFVFLIKLIREHPKSNISKIFFKIFAILLLSSCILQFVTIFIDSALFETIIKVLLASFFAVIVGMFYQLFPKIVAIPSSEELKATQVQLQNVKELEEKTAGQLKDSENRSAQIMEVASVGMVIMDMEGNLQLINSAIQKISGYSPEEISSLKFDAITHPDDLLLDSEDFKALMAGQIQHYTLERRYFHKKGYYFWAKVNVSLLRDKENKPLNIIVQAMDITEKKQSDKKIKELNESLEDKIQQRTEELDEVHREMAEYTYTITHDLRQPLRNLSGLSEEVAQEYTKDLDEEGKYMLYLIKQNAEKMDTLLTDLMTFAKAREIKLEKTEVDLERLFKENLDSQKHEYPHNELIYHIGTLPKAYGDPNTLGQVVQNLVGNALKYSSKSTKIEIAISGWRSGDNVTYQISDNGVGFDESQSEQLFIIFKRLHTSSEFEGTGLGLAMCQRIIKKHGGELWATSKIGEGSSFFFSLPKIPEVLSAETN